MAALQYVDVPSYNAILFRRTYKDLALPGAIMDRSHQWLGNHKEIHWDGENKRWEFPSGATLSFAYLDSENDKYRYQGAEFQFVGFDELTQFTESMYRYLFSRLRRLAGVNVPVRMRAASNPGGVGHEWVKQRFITEGKLKGRIFIPAKLADNPYLDQEEYKKSLEELDPVTMQQLLNGDWTARQPGGFFDSSLMPKFDELPLEVKRFAHWVRFWDTAATKPREDYPDPDWTCGVLIGEYQGEYWIADVRRFRKNPAETENEIRETALLDRALCGAAGFSGVDIFMGQEPGSAGVSMIDHYAREVLKGFTFIGHKETGNKMERAKPVAAASRRGHVHVKRAAWTTDFLDELEAFPSKAHDDQVDALSGGYQALESTDFTTVPFFPERDEEEDIGPKRVVM